MTVLLQARLLDVPLAGCYPCSPDTANALLAAWGHRLGPVRRPFTQVGYVLEAAGAPVAVAMSGSTVSATVGGYTRGEVVELTRLCADPAAAWASRLMLRLWREICAPLWPDWPVRAAVSYSHNALHGGELYRFDGWTRVSDSCGKSGGGGAWSRKRYATDVIKGAKSLWVWRYES